jgi:hypothetical protein
MIEWSMKNELERIWKERVVASFTVLDLNPGPPEYEAVMLTTQLTQLCHLIRFNNSDLHMN